MTRIIGWLSIGFADSYLLNQLLARMDTVGNSKRN